MVSGLTRNQMPRKGLWVRIPCPPHYKAFCSNMLRQASFFTFL